MKFYDEGLKAYVETKEEAGGMSLYIDEQRFTISIPANILKQYPEWVVKDAIRLIARQTSRKAHVDQLAERIVKGER